MSRRSRCLGLAVVAVLVAARPSIHAQGTVLGTFRWQLQPFCNVITVSVVQQGSLFRIEGTDDQCGAARSGSVVGMAFPNPDGSIGFGLTTVTPPGGTALHTDVALSLATIGGTWRDSAGNSGDFVLTPGAGSGGSPRPVPPGGIAPGTITAAQIAGGAITAAQIADGTITAADIAPGVISAGVADGSITTAKLGAGAVTSAKVANAAITSAHLAPSALTRALDCQNTAETVLNVAAGGTANAVAPACAAGFTQTSTNCESTTWQMPFVYMSAGICSAQNNSGSPASLSASRTCCRVP